MDVKRIRELISFLVSMAAQYNEEDAEMARIFADELDELLPPIAHHDVGKYYP